VTLEIQSVGETAYETMTISSKSAHEMGVEFVNDTALSLISFQISIDTFMEKGSHLSSFGCYMSPALGIYWFAHIVFKRFMNDQNITAPLYIVQ